ncbi:crotonase/enoyl-CoA hydratase family protein [Cupriavidus alkaliphilus]|uniref:crotonase/enoyl-CoA hydratase family protein n=1 Tax=Cupriavidus alkaliphilus TaxID=942866 RepID=UPI000DC202B5|nr:crotonase/enoyl-CoA hydratase family protein [Cupriavidus alkaliphilus]MBB2919989.1 enoyl-CoA hydratase/carnithine racemase [Cupriavidus alkaliphilus]RAS03479.1 enoyl-CoA hydratase/carnithine racemase [Cupriavidus alkaliphilus]
MSEFLKFEKIGHVAVATMNRPQTRNALSDADAIAGLVAMCEAVNRDLSVRVLVLTGAGPAFSSGGNLKTLRDSVGTGLGEPAQSRYAYRDGIQRVPLALYELEVPTIAAVNGPAYGAGNDLACMCDIRIASETAVFAESFVKLGLLPGDGGAWLLPRAVGMSRACEMSFTGEPVDAQQALAWGLVSSVVPADELMPAALALAQRIAANPAHALRMTKRLLREGQHTRLSSLLEMSAGFQALAHHTAEHEAALDGFLRR